MKKQSSFFRRLVSLVTTLLISFSGTPGFSAPSSSDSVVLSAHAFSSSLASEILQIPRQLGRVESFHAGKGKTLIHIQTAHGHYEAQKKIAAILQDLENQYGTTTVFIEGSWGKLYPEILRFFPENPKLTHELNDALTHKAIVKGEELYLIDSKKGEGYGIENEQAYLENAAAFASVVKAREGSRKFLTAAMDGIEKISAGYLNNDLRGFLRREESFQNGVTPLDSWIEELHKQVTKQYGQDLADAAFQLEWPMLVRYFTIKKLESSMNVETLDSERVSFLKEFDKVSSLRSPVSGLKDSIESLLSAKDASLGLQAEMVQSIFIQMMRALPQDFDYSRYPNVKAMIGILLLQSELDAHLMTAEIEKLTNLLAGKMATQATEKQFLSVYQRKILLTKLLNLELAPDDYEKILGSPASGLRPSHLFLEIQKLNTENRVRGIEFKHTAELDAIYEKALAFYAGAKKRDQYLIENVEKQMDQLGVDKAVVITGGFHAEPFRKYFEAKNYTYALLMPTLSSVDDKGREAYLNVMNEQLKIKTKTSTANTISPATRAGVSTLEAGLASLSSEDGNLALAGVERSESRLLSLRAKASTYIAAVLFALSSASPVSAQTRRVLPVVPSDATAQQAAFDKYMETADDGKLAASFASFVEKKNAPAYLLFSYAKAAAKQGRQETVVRQLGLIIQYLVDAYQFNEADLRKVLEALDSNPEIRQNSGVVAAVKSITSLVPKELVGSSEQKKEKPVASVIIRAEGGKGLILGPSETVTEKSTGEEIKLTGIQKGSPEELLFNQFFNGGDVVQPGGVNPKDASRVKFSLQALAQIHELAPEKRVQFVKSMFDLLPAMKPALPNEKEFKEIKRITLSELANTFYLFKFPPSAISFFLNELVAPKNSSLVADPFFRPYVLALVSELVDQLSMDLLEYKKWAQSVLIKEYEVFIAKFADDAIRKVLVAPEEALGPDTRMWYMRMTGVLLSAPNFIDPFVKVAPLAPSVGGGDRKYIENSKAVDRFSQMVPTSRLRSFILNYFVLQFQDKDLLKKISKRTDPRKFMPLTTIINAFVVTQDPKVLQEMEKISTIVDLPESLRTVVVAKIVELKFGISQKKAKEKRSEMRDAVADDFLLPQGPTIDVATLKRMAETFKAGIYSLAAKVVAGMGFQPKSLILPTVDSILPLPQDVSSLGGNVVSIFTPDNAKAEAKIVIAQKFSAFPEATSDFKQLLSWARYIASHKGLVWSFQVTQSQEASARSFRQMFLQLASQNGLQISQNQIFLERVPAGVFNLSKFAKLDLAAIAPDAAVLSPLNVGIKGRVILTAADGIDGLAAGLIVTAEALLSPLGFPQKVVRASELHPFGLDYQAVLMAVAAFARAA